MPRHEAVRPMTDGQRTDIIATLVQAIPPLSFADAENVGSKKGAFITDVRAVFAKYSLEWTTNRHLVEWHRFYKKYFGLDLNFSGITIPERREGFDRLIVVAQGITIQQAFEKCREMFGVWKYTDADLDEVVTLNDRDTKLGHYAIWVRDRIEADEENKNRSANQLKGANINGETLLERLLHELKYYTETKKHLDILNVTLCCGSRYSDGDVPKVRWYDTGRLSVYGCSPGAAFDGLRCREVVSAVA